MLAYSFAIFFCHRIHALSVRAGWQDGRHLCDIERGKQLLESELVERKRGKTGGKSRVVEQGGGKGSSLNK